MSKQTNIDDDSVKETIHGRMFGYFAFEETCIRGEWHPDGSMIPSILYNIAFKPNLWRDIDTYDIKKLYEYDSSYDCSDEDFDDNPSSFDALYDVYATIDLKTPYEKKLDHTLRESFEYVLKKTILAQSEKPSVDNSNKTNALQQDNGHFTRRRFKRAEKYVFFLCTIIIAVLFYNRSFFFLGLNLTLCYPKKI